MKEFKGTKGEWEVIANDYYYDIKLKGTCHNLANTQKNKYIGIYNAEEYANAKLIASAPDLLKALQEVYDDLRQGAIPNDLKFIEEAINKAL